MIATHPRQCVYTFSMLLLRDARVNRTTRLTKSARENVVRASRTSARVPGCRTATDGPSSTARHLNGVRHVNEGVLVPLRSNAPTDATLTSPPGVHPDGDPSRGGEAVASVATRDHDAKADATAYSSAIWDGSTGDRAEPRGVVGFEVVLGALLAALDRGVSFSIHGGGELRHGLF